MSSTTDRIASVEEKAMPPKTLPWALWLRQISAVLRLELKKNFLSRRALLIYLLALLPVLLLAMLMIVPPDADEFRNLTSLSMIFSGIYQGLILRTVVFFGCAWIFMNLFRGEVVDRSLHYYFLSPVRREVLVVGKYVSGLLTSIILFAGTTVVSNLLLFLPRGYTAQYYLDGPGLGQLLTYVGITVLACVGYGAVFLLIGLLFRNPIIPALVVYGWEWLNFLLPPLLKKLSVVHYLQSLVPLPISHGPFAIIAEPTPAWISVPGLLVMTSLVLVLASLQIRQMEIKYGDQ